MQNSGLSVYGLASAGCPSSRLPTTGRASLPACQRDKMRHLMPGRQSARHVVINQQAMIFIENYVIYNPSPCTVLRLVSCQLSARQAAGMSAHLRFGMSCTCDRSSSQPRGLSRITSALHSGCALQQQDQATLSSHGGINQPCRWLTSPYDYLLGIGNTASRAVCIRAYCIRTSVKGLISRGLSACKRQGPFPRTCQCWLTA